MQIEINKELITGSYSKMNNKNYIKESVQWDDLTDVEKIAYEYANDYLNQGYSIEDAVTQGCFTMMYNFEIDNDDIEDYEDPDPRKIKSFLMHKYKAPFGRKPSKVDKPLFVIQDKHGNQLSAPSEDDYELWDRVAAMEARGRRGLSVVAYTEGFKGINMKVKNLTEDTINKQFRKDIKRKYKDNQFINSVNKEKRADTMSMVKGKGLDKDPAFMEFVKDHMNDKYPLKPFKYKFPKYLEKNDFPFYVTYYQEYPIYEPAEGGYYYPGRDAIYSKGFDTKEEAEAHVEELKNEDGEGGWEKSSDGYVRKGKYVGDAEEIVIETRKTYLSQEKGWEPYQ